MSQTPLPNPEQTPLLPWTLSFLRPYRGAWRCSRCCCCPRSGSARCSRGRSRSSSTTCSAASRSGRHAWPASTLPVAGDGGADPRQPARPCWSSSSSPAWCCRSSTSSCRPTARRCRSTPASGWSTTCATGCSSICTALGLHHHITTSTGDAVYRVDVDAYAIENLVMSGMFPLATSIIALAVMFGILLQHERHRSRCCR